MFARSHRWPKRLLSVAPLKLVPHSVCRLYRSGSATLFGSALCLLQRNQESQNMKGCDPETNTTFSCFCGDHAHLTRPPTVFNWHFVVISLLWADSVNE